MIEDFQEGMVSGYPYYPSDSLIPFKFDPLYYPVSKKMKEILMTQRKPIDPTTNLCTYCKRSFSRKDDRIRHENYRCKASGTPCVHAVKKVINGILRCTGCRKKVKTDIIKGESE